MPNDSVATSPESRDSAMMTDPHVESDEAATHRQHSQVVRFCVAALLIASTWQEAVDLACSGSVSWFGGYSMQGQVSGCPFHIRAPL